MCVSSLLSRLAACREQRRASWTPPAPPAPELGTRARHRAHVWENVPFHTGTHTHTRVLHALVGTSLRQILTGGGGGWRGGGFPFRSPSVLLSDGAEDPWAIHHLPPGHRTRPWLPCNVWENNPILHRWLQGGFNDTRILATSRQTVVEIDQSYQIILKVWSQDLGFQQMMTHSVCCKHPPLWDINFESVRNLQYVHSK